MTDPTRTVRNIPRFRATLKRERKIAEEDGLEFGFDHSLEKGTILHLRKSFYKHSLFHSEWLLSYLYLGATVEM